MENCIDLNDYVIDNDVFQIQINNKELIIKKIGKGKESKDVIICENIGVNKNLTLFSIVYTINELNYYDDLGKIYNLLKLHEKKNNVDNVFNLSVKINEKMKPNKIITDFEIFFISNKLKNEEQYFKKITNTINKNNMIETIISEYMLVN